MNNNIVRLKYHDIEIKIYKILSTMKDKETIKISDLLKYIQIMKPFNAKLTFPEEAILKSLILMGLKGIRFQTKITKYLSENEEDALNLGFLRDSDNKILVPNQRTFSHFVKHRLTNEDKKLINFIVNKIEEICQKFGIVFDVETLKPKKKEGGTAETLDNRRDKKLNELCRYVEKNIYPQIDLSLRHNAIYSKADFLNLLNHVVLTKDFTENGSKTYRKLKKERSPVGRTFLYHLRKYDEWGRIQQNFIRLFNFVYKMAVNSGVVDRRKGYYVALDTTPQYYYGNRNDEMIVGTKPGPGTCYAYKYATTYIAEEGSRFTLLPLPIGPLTQEIKVVEELLKDAQRKVKIKMLYVDRHYFNTSMINLFNRMGIVFLMPVTSYPNIKKLLGRATTPFVIKNYNMGKEKKAVFNIVFLKGDNNKTFAYATNMKISKKDIGLITNLIFLYKKRFGIESSYRVKKRDLFARTTSKNYKVRIFYFMYSVLLYNIWILIKSLTAFHLYGTFNKDPDVSAKLFGTILYMNSLVT